MGGAVRDALLGLPPGPDLDLVAEGDALPVARRLAAALGARLVVHPRFGTAALELPGGVRVDLATARRERYPAPGALPEVEPGTLDDDLARRDLTINAIALAVAGPAAGELRDPHGGLADLRAGLVRALREDAFLEDPSRLLRAARYAARLGFALAPQTAAAARAAAAAASAGSARVGEELRRLLAEPAPVAAGGVAIAAGLGVPWLVDRPDAEALAAEFAALDAALGREGAPPLAAWALRLGRAVRGERLPAAAVPGWARAVAAGAGEGAALADRLSDPALAPSTVDGILRGAPAAAQVAALAAGAEPVARWWSRWRDLAPEVGGADLVAAGVPPGPAMGRALRAVRAAVLDGRVGGRDEQLALALRLVAEEG